MIPGLFSRLARPIFLVLSVILFLRFEPAIAKPAGAIKRLDQATKFLNGSKVMSLDVEKTVTSELLGKTTVSTGEVVIGSGKFRWETKSPEAGLIVYDGKNLWTLQPASKDLGGPAQVTKSHISGKSRDQVLVKALGGGKMSSKFEVVSADPVDGDTLIKMRPAKEDPTVKDFAVLVGGRPEVLKEIRYVDEVGNITKIRVLSVKPMKKPTPGLFEFVPPKGAQVTNL